MRWLAIAVLLSGCDSAAYSDGAVDDSAFAAAASEECLVQEFPADPADFEQWAHDVFGEFCRWQEPHAGKRGDELCVPVTWDSYSPQERAAELRHGLVHDCQGPVWQGYSADTALGRYVLETQAERAELGWWGRMGAQCASLLHRLETVPAQMLDHYRLHELGTEVTEDIAQVLELEIPQCL